jgi:hypothetical protein
VAPKVLRPSLDYHVSISLHGGAPLTNLVVAIEGQQDGGGQVRNAQSATVEPNSTQVIKFQVLFKKLNLLFQFSFDPFILGRLVNWDPVNII